MTIGKRSRREEEEEKEETEEKEDGTNGSSSSWSDEILPGWYLSGGRDPTVQRQVSRGVLA
jgi:hypothetical protein